MKKVILGAASILSLALFSFAPQSTGNVWRLADGNYLIEPRACLTFTPADQSSVKSLMSQIYGRPFTEETVVQPQVCAATGGSVLDYKISEAQIETKFTKWDDCAAYQVGTPQHKLVSIIDRYAK